MSDQLTDEAVTDSLSDSLPSRAPADQGTREQGNEGSEQGSSSNSPSTPTSRNAPDEPATMDGGSTLDGAASPTPRPVDTAVPSQPIERFRLTVLGQWMCVTCGAVVEYFDGRGLHEAWHRAGAR